VPVSLTDAAYKNFNANNTLPRLWLSPDKMEDSLDTEVEPESWILANIQGGGFYRVNYDERNWRLLSQQLHANHEAIHVLNRAHLISDAFAVAGVGLMSFGTVFDMLKYAKKEDHNVPWVTMRDGMAYIKDMVTSSRIERGFKSFMYSLTLPAMVRIGIHAKPDEDCTIAKTRAMLLKEACDNNWRNCYFYSKQKFEEWMASGNVDNFTGIETEHRLPIYCTAVRRGDKNNWYSAWQMVLKSRSSHHRSTLLSALACIEDAAILRHYLRLSMNPDVDLYPHEQIEVIESVARNKLGRYLAFDFIEENFDYLVTRYTVPPILQAFATATSTFNKKSEISKVSKFLGAKQSMMSLYPENTRNILATVVSNNEWMNRNAYNIAEWLRSNGLHSSSRRPFGLNWE